MVNEKVFRFPLTRQAHHFNNAYGMNLPGFLLGKPSLILNYPEGLVIAKPSVLQRPLMAATMWPSSFRAIASSDQIINLWAMQADSGVRNGYLNMKASLHTVFRPCFNPIAFPNISIWACGFPKKKHPAFP